MTRFSVLLSAVALVLAIAAMSATGSGIRDVVDPDLTDEVEALVEGSVLSEYAGLGRTPIPAAAPVPVAVDNAPLVEIPLVIDGYAPLTDLDALYGVYGYSLPAAAVLPAPAHVEPPVDLVDDTPAMIVAAWSNPPPDAK